MKLSFYIYKLLFFAVLLGAVQNSYAQTPKEIDIALKLAQFFDIKIYDSYTLSYFINEKDSNGNPIYNNGLLIQTKNKNKILKKTFYNQKTTPLLDIVVKEDSLISETLQKIDSVHIYSNGKHQIEVTKSNKIYRNTLLSAFGAKKVPTFMQDTITKTLVNVTKNKKGEEIMKWVQNNEKHHAIDSSKVKAPLYADEAIYIYNYNKDGKLILNDNTEIGYYEHLNLVREEGKIESIKHKDLNFNPGRIKLISGAKYKNNTYLLKLIINKVYYQIIYTVDKQNQLQSFTYYHYEPNSCRIEENVMDYCPIYNCIANAIILCN